MDKTKCNRLKASLFVPDAPQIVPVEVFFDGNNDNASMGCNLTKHPGIAAFRTIFLGLLQRPDVVAAYAQISEADPGEEFWPFADLVFIVGTIPREELTRYLAPLQPDDVGPPGDFVVPEAIARQHEAPVLVAWWD